MMQPGGYQGSSEEQLVRLARQGSEEAFAELMRRHGSAVRKTALGILRNEGDAEDELQNVWRKAWKHLGGFEGDSRFSTWLTRIVMNQCLMRLRQGRRAAFVYLDAEIRDESGTPEDRFCRDEMRRVVTREIGRIPPLLRRRWCFGKSTSSRCPRWLNAWGSRWRQRNPACCEVATNSASGWRNTAPGLTA